MATGLHVRPEGLLPASPPRRSLLDVPGVQVQGAMLNLPWRNGIAVEPEGCTITLDYAALSSSSTDYPYWWEVCDASDTAAEDAIPSGIKNVGAGAENVVAEAFTIWRGYRCSTLDLHTPERFDEIVARLRRGLLACTPAVVEHELWTGQVANAAGFDTPALMDLAPADEIQGGAQMGYVTALAELEQAAADCVCSGEHVIHAQPRVVALWASENLLRVSPDGRYLETVATGCYVVGGSGYPGTTPDDVDPSYSHSYAYLTGGVRVFLSPPETPTTVGSPDAITAAVIDPVNNPTITGVNTTTLRAERDALVIFDACCHKGVEIGLCDALCGGGS